MHSTPPQQGRAPHVLIVVQNLPVPLDRRVWLECLALRGAGYEVSVICPKGPGDPAFETIDGVRIHKYDPAPEVDGTLSYIREFVQSWFATARRSLRVWRTAHFDVIQACNPPDTYWALGRLWRARGVRFVYDQHDLNPELFLSRFGVPKRPLPRLQLRTLKWLEQRTYRAADRVISTNQSYRRVALERGGCVPDHVTVVRSGPDTTRMRPAYATPAGMDTAKFQLVYLGIMGPQDGVDLLLDAFARLLDRTGRRDIHLNLLGFGDCLPQLEAQAHAAGLDEHVTFTGRADRRMIAQYLSAADIGVGPDPCSPLNDVSTMNKTMEYMAYALPVVTFDLTETRFSLGDCGVIVPDGDIDGFATAIEKLLEDDALRHKLGTMARERVSRELDWEAQRRAYVGVYDGLLGRSGPDGSRSPGQDSRGSGTEAVDEWGHRLVDLRSATGLEDFFAWKDGLRKSPLTAGRA